MRMDGMKTSSRETTHWDMAGQRFPAKHAADSECTCLLMGARILDGLLVNASPFRVRNFAFIHFL